MPRSRVLRVTGETVISPRSRVLKVSGSGTVVATPKSRVLRVSGSGPVSVIVNPLPNLPGLEPATVVTITPHLVGGLTADSWACRVVSGVATTIFGTGPTFDITTPSHIDGTTVTIGVRATKDGVTSPEVTFTMGALPQNEWWWTGAQLVPARETWHVDSSSDPPEFGAGIFGTGQFGA